MSKQIQINTAQQILYALGVTFPLYSQMHADKSRTSTKKGPGRRHLQGGRNAPFAERLRATVYANTYAVGDARVVRRKGTHCCDIFSTKTGDWGYGARNGTVYARGYLKNWPLFAAKGI